MRILLKIKQALFSSVTNTIITVSLLYILYLIVPPVVNWALINATWVAAGKQECAANGACWAFILSRIKQFLFGFYPSVELWRILVAGLLLIAAIFYFYRHKSAKALVNVAVIYVISAWIILHGGAFGLSTIESSKWGGLFLTIVLSLSAMLLAFPLGIILALGRRSEMVIIKSAAVAFIEIIRGVPLISLLFMASVMLPLFLPAGVDIDKLLRAIIGITLFQAAYMAEAIRGGLQVIPKGQYEASAALGLDYWQSMRLIVLPQALKISVPSIVNTFIALFKDTTLVLVIGLFDFLGIMQAATSDPKWLGAALEGYVFCAIVYWLFCYSMSKYSRRLELKNH